MGKCSVIDIGVPQTSAWRVWSEEDVRMTMPKRTGNTHKGTFGTALLVAGSDEMPGSAALAAVGALGLGQGSYRSQQRNMQQRLSDRLLQKRLFHTI